MNKHVINLVDPIWVERPKSNIVKWLMKESGRSVCDLANGLGCSVQYFNNKLHRDSFSMEDVVIIAYMCGYTIGFMADESDDAYLVDTSSFESTKAFYELKKSEYKALKAKVEQMECEFGFED